MTHPVPSLSAPARYFPLESGTYEVAPGLKILGSPLGNGPADALMFQLDSEFEKYRRNKAECRLERLGKYHRTHDFRPEVESAVARFLLDRLVQEHPSCFELSKTGTGDSRLHCRLTGEILVLDCEFRLVAVEGAGHPEPPYSSAFDALCSQVQEDVAVVSRNASKQDWLSAIHLCSPSHWAAEEKIGKNFFAIHAPVAGIEKINRAASSFVDAMIRKGPYVRFVWGFGTDDRLNHHPEAAPGWDPLEWKGRSFDLARKPTPFILRVERQTIMGLPEADSAIFTIRVSFVPGDAIQSKERELLRSALLSMTPEQRVYKGVSSDFSEIVSWLHSD